MLSVCVLFLIAMVATQAWAEVTVHVVRPASFGDVFAVSSNLMVEREVGISTRVSGVVESIFVDRGARVRKGQALARLDQREFNLDRAAAEENFRLRDAEYRRYQQLAEQQLASQAELEQRRAAYEVARVDYEKARLIIDRSVIRAPFDGVIVDRFVRLGQKVLLDENEILFKISALRPLIARAYLPSSMIGTVRNGDSVLVRSPELPELRTTAKVSFISPVVEPSSGAFQVIVTLPEGAPALLRPGMAVQLSFAASPKGLTLPSGCLIPGNGRRDGTGEVFEVVGDRLRRKRIRYAPVAPDAIRVLSGIGADARIVLSPSAEISDGDRVTISR